MKPAESTPVKAKHTPGPWSIHRRSATSVEDEGGRLVASTGGRQSNVRDESPENEANALLVASAPDFYRGALLVINSPPHSDDFDLGMTILCNSIDRTEGRKPTP